MLRGLLSPRSAAPANEQESNNGGNQMDRIEALLSSALDRITKLEHGGNQQPAAEANAAALAAAPAAKEGSHEAGAEHLGMLASAATRLSFDAGLQQPLEQQQKPLFTQPPAPSAASTLPFSGIRNEAAVRPGQPVFEESAQHAWRQMRR